jgi:TrmH family RNA methyltransferase
VTDSTITSTANPLVKELAALGSRRGREDAGKFLIEGRREVGRAIAAGFAIDTIIICEELTGADPVPGASGVRVMRFGERAFHKLSRRQNPDGIAARATTPSLEIEDAIVSRDALVLVAEGIEKPGNLGAMLRSAEAMGVDAVVLADPITDPFNPNVVRASQGAVFAVRLLVAATHDVITWLGHNDLDVIAGSPDGGEAPWNVDMTGGVALVIGAEAEGLGPSWRSVGTAVTIPMAAGVGSDSFNAATSAALLLYEARRQRIVRS